MVKIAICEKVFFTAKISRRFTQMLLADERRCILNMNA